MFGPPPWGLLCLCRTAAQCQSLARGRLSASQAAIKSAAAAAAEAVAGQHSRHLESLMQLKAKVDEVRQCTAKNAEKARCAFARNMSAAVCCYHQERATCAGARMQPSPYVVASWRSAWLVCQHRECMRTHACSTGSFLQGECVSVCAIVE